MNVWQNTCSPTAKTRTEVTCTTAMANRDHFRVHVVPERAGILQFVPLRRFWCVPPLVQSHELKQLLFQLSTTEPGAL